MRSGAMKNQYLKIAIFSLAFMIVIMSYLNLSIKSEYKTSKENFLTFEKSAKEIYNIKRMKKKTKYYLTQLQRIQRPSITSRTKSIIYTFENLNQNSLNSLLKKIKGSYIPIKHLEIKRDATNHATIILEIYK